MSIQSNLNNALITMSAGIGIAAKESGRTDYLKDKKAFKNAEKEYETLYQKGKEGGLSDIELERMSRAAERAYTSGQKAQSYKSNEELDEKLGELSNAREQLKITNPKAQEGDIKYGDAEFVWENRGETYGGDRPWHKKGEEKLEQQRRGAEMRFAVDRARASRIAMEDAQTSKRFKAKGARGWEQQGVPRPVMPGAGMRTMEDATTHLKEEK